MPKDSEVFLRQLSSTQSDVFKLLVLSKKQTFPIYNAILKKKKKEANSHF